MNNSLSIGAIILGVIALIIGVLSLTGALGTHHTLPYIALAAGVILLIIGIVGMVMSRNRGRV
ncbi:MAG: hypothetical protein NVS3B14_12220 [Ktedonobacteraceae bacterium]